MDVSEKHPYLGVFFFVCLLIPRRIILLINNSSDERDRAECVYIQLLHGLDEFSDEDG